ncbi:MAG TPA: hypothetical protein VLQ91_01755 [Draconibacterium sp.]|nr:hypothetical protein [Draconibacterium sp.]
MKLPNVVNVAIGLKETSGELTDDIVFQIFVIDKVEKDSLDPSELIPKKIKGYKTDVVRVPKAVNRIDSSEHRPVTGGLQISNGKGHVGTLGCFAQLVIDDTLVLLSNEHVLYSDSAVAGDKIGQPNLDNKCCCCCAYVDGEIGTILSPAINNSKVDCAIASVKSGIATDYVLNNSMAGSELHMDGIDTAVVGDLVRKVGRTSGLTNGTVSSINGPTSSKTGQIFIRPVASETYTESTNGKKAFSDGGDSGSIIIDEANNVIGLLWGGDPDTYTVDETYACHINDVLAALRDAGKEIILMYTPEDRSAIAHNATLHPQRLDLDIRSRLLETEKGSVFVNLYEIHQKEVLSLINNNRKVKVMWHRLQGPAFTAHIARSYREREYIIPQEIKGINLQELMIKMAEILKENGSQELRKDIEVHALSLINDTYRVTSLEKYLEKILSKEVVMY